MSARSPARSAADRSTAPGIEEQPERRGIRGVGERWPGSDQVVVHGPGGIGAQRDAALLAALSGQRDGAGLQVDVITGATDTSEAFIQSLIVALTQATY